MKIEDAKVIFLLEHCAERCDGYQKDDACDNCEINAAIKALEKQIPFIPETNNLKVGLGRCKCGAEFLDKLTNYCGNCGQRIFMGGRGMTERLTVSGATTQRDIDKLLELSNENQFGRNEAYYKLQHYEDLEEQGRLVELPCKIGDTVYGRFQCYDGKKIRECKIIEIRACHFKADSECYYFVDVEFNIIDPFYMDGRLMTCRHQAVIGNDYGSWERVFFTREEAEKAE